MKLDIAGPTYQLAAKSFDVQRCVNLYPLASETGTSKERKALRGTPGLELFTTIGGGPIRGQFTTSQERSFAVSGNEFYEIFGNGTSEKRGELLTQTNRVSMSENGQQVIIVDKFYGYIFDLNTNSFTQITAEGFPGGDRVVFQDGYFLVNKPNSGEFYISGLYDGLTWSALDFTTVESSTDDLVCVIADHGEVWAFGTRSVEVYYNSGNADFPFERISGARMEAGCAAAFTVQKFDNSLMWLGVDDRGRGVIWRATEAYRPQRVSTEAIERLLGSVSDLSDSYAYVYHQEGHIYYVLQIRGLNTTLVYDGTTGQWHERMYFNNRLGAERKHRGATHTFFDQKNLIGDRENGNIYRMALDIYSDNGDEIHRIRVCPHIHDEMDRLFYHELQIDTEPGTGLTTGQGNDPKLMMRYSDDGGFTYSKERFASLGKRGEYANRARYKRLGSGRDRIFEIRYSDPTFFQINGAYLQVSPGAH